MNKAVRNVVILSKMSDMFLFASNLGSRTYYDLYIKKSRKAKKRRKSYDFFIHHNM